MHVVISALAVHAGEVGNEGPEIDDPTPKLNSPKGRSTLAFAFSTLIKRLYHQ